MDYTPYDLLIDVGWISLLMIVGNFLRNRIRVFQQLLLPASITAGLLGLVLGPEVLGWIGFSDRIGTYTTLLIAVVFASMAYSMELGGTVSKGARNMWSYSTGIFMAQWGVFILLGVYFFTPVFGVEEWFGMMVPVGFVGGFGTAAAVGSSLEAVGAEGASSLGFTAATVGTLSGIVGGIIVATWGMRTGRAAGFTDSKLPEDMRTGYIAKVEERPSIGRATTNPSAIEPMALHVGIVVFTVLAAYLVNGVINSIFPTISVPLFAMSFVLGLLGRGLLHATKRPDYLDRQTIGGISGAATDYLIAFGIASIVPAAVADYWLELVILFLLGILSCVLFLFVGSPIFFGKYWLERGLFSWGWATGSVSTGIALLKMVDPHQKSGTLNEYGLAYVGFAPFEIGMTILAPIAIIAGFTTGFGWISLIVAVAIIGTAFALKWVPVKPGQDVTITAKERSETLE